MELNFHVMGFNLNSSNTLRVMKSLESIDDFKHQLHTVLITLKKDEHVAHVFQCSIDAHTTFDQSFVLASEGKRPDEAISNVIGLLKDKLHHQYAYSIAS
jgi:hypothetical protein